MDWNFKHLEQTLNFKCLFEIVGRYFSITSSCRYMSKTILPQTNIQCPETSHPSPLIMPNITFLRLEEESYDYTWWVHSDGSWHTFCYTVIKVSSIQIITILKGRRQSNVPFILEEEKMWRKIVLIWLLVKVESKFTTQHEFLLCFHSSTGWKGNKNW